MGAGPDVLCHPKSNKSIHPMFEIKVGLAFMEYGARLATSFVQTKGNFCIY